MQARKSFSGFTLVKAYEMPASKDISAFGPAESFSRTLHPYALVAAMGEYLRSLRLRELRPDPSLKTSTFNLHSPTGRGGKTILLKLASKGGKMNFRAQMVYVINTQYQFLLKHDIYGLIRVRTQSIFFSCLAFIFAPNTSTGSHAGMARMRYSNDRSWQSRKAR